MLTNWWLCDLFYIFSDYQSQTGRSVVSWILFPPPRPPFEDLESIFHSFGTWDDKQLQTGFRQGSSLRASSASGRNPPSYMLVTVARGRKKAWQYRPVGVWWMRNMLPIEEGQNTDCEWNYVLSPHTHLCKQEKKLVQLLFLTGYLEEEKEKGKWVSAIYFLAWSMMQYVTFSV